MPGEVAADEVYLAAGSLGTTEILLRSRDLFRTLDRVSDRLGRGWSANGDFLSLRDPSPSPGFAHARPRRCRAPSRSSTVPPTVPEFFLEDGGFPDLMGNVLREVVHAQSPCSPAIDSRRSGSCRRSSVPMHRVMPWFCQGIDAVGREPEPEAPASAVGALGSSSSTGTPKRRSRSWTRSPTCTGRSAARPEGTSVVPPSWTLARYLISPHPLGGARMADSAPPKAWSTSGARCSAIRVSSWWTGRRFPAPSDSIRRARSPRWPNAWRHVPSCLDEDASAQRQSGWTTGAPGRGPALGCMRRVTMRY